MSDKETQQLIHELQVHQIELEMQNDELRKAQSDSARQIGVLMDTFLEYVRIDRAKMMKTKVNPNQLVKVGCNE